MDTSLLNLFGIGYVDFLLVAGSGGNYTTIGAVTKVKKCRQPYRQLCLLPWVCHYFPMHIIQAHNSSNQIISALGVRFQQFIEPGIFHFKQTLLIIVEMNILIVFFSLLAEHIVDSISSTGSIDISQNLTTING